MRWINGLGMRLMCHQWNPKLHSTLININYYKGISSGGFRGGKGGANAPPFGGTLKNDYAAMACSNNNQADPGVVRWVRSNPPSYQRTYRMALLYFQALACSGDEQLSNTLRKTYVAVTVRSTVVPGTKFTA